MLQKVLTGGDIGSVVFIEKRGLIDAELETAYCRQQLLKEQKLFDEQISQTEYLIAVFRNRPVILDDYDEKLFRMIIDTVTAYPGQRLVFRLKNGLELEETYGKEM